MEPMALAGRTGIGVTVSAVCGALILFGPLDLAGARRESGAAPVLSERPGCGGPPVLSGSPSRADDNTQTLMVTVQRVSVLRLDDSGRIVAAMTNTGCAPRPGDELFYARPDGSLVPASTAALANRRWVGNFTVPGVTVPQTQSKRVTDAEHHD